MIDIYHDRSHISKVSNDIKTILRDNNLLLNKDKHINFCGMVLHENQAHIFFPRNSALAITVIEKQKASRLFIQAIYKFSQQSKAINYVNDNGVDFIGKSQLGLVMSILKDFQINGLYSQRLIDTVFNSGKTNWNKTISRSIACPTHNGPIYFDTWGNKHRYSRKSEITKIHAAVIKQLINNLGWLVSDDLETKNLNQVPMPSSESISIQLSLIDKELQVSYSDRDIWLLSQLKRYIGNQKGAQSTPEVIGIRSFHIMWEHMLYTIIPNKLEVNSLLPSPAYEMQNESGIPSIINAKRNSQRTDIVIKKPLSDEYCVIDAKYYGASSLTSVPGWPDLVKQFFYVTALKTIIPDKSFVRNAFIFPGSTHGPILKAHMRDKESGELLDSIYPPISCYYICPSQVIEHYIKNKPLKSLYELLISNDKELSKTQCINSPVETDNISTIGKFKGSTKSE